MTVLTSSRDINTKDGAQIYFAHAIQHVDGVTLSRAGLFLIALLAGGDYDKGVPGCGMGIVHGLAQCHTPGRRRLQLLTIRRHLTWKDRQLASRSTSHPPARLGKLRLIGGEGGESTRR
jgi:hypothetical protein